MYKKGDFHIHSTVSDGALTPSQIVNKAKARNIDILALTDHNCINGISEALKKGNNIGIKVIPGVELSTRFYDAKVHVLGYFPSENIEHNLYEALKLVKTHNLKLFNKFISDKLNISYRREHISVEKGIALLKYFGATVILAHPVLLPKQHFETIASLGFDGIEAKYFINSEADTDFFVNYALSHNMIYTAGSDFHRDTELYRAHGNIGDVFLNESEINKFLNHLYKN